jgi:hypothetical protein
VIGGTGVHALAFLDGNLPQSLGRVAHQVDGIVDRRRRAARQVRR